MSFSPSGFFSLSFRPLLRRLFLLLLLASSLPHLHPQADAQVRLLRRTRVTRGQDLALHAAPSKASRDEDAVGLLEGRPRRRIAAVGRLAVAAGPRGSGGVGGAARGLPSPSVRLRLLLLLLPAAAGLPRLQLFGLDPLQVEPAVGGEAGVLQGLDDREVGVREAGVLADDGDGDGLREGVPAVGEGGPPVGEVCFFRWWWWWWRWCW